MSNSGGILKESDTEVVGRDMKVKIVDKENPDKMKEKGAKKVSLLSGILYPCSN